MTCSGISGDVGLYIPGCQPFDLSGTTDPKRRVVGFATIHQGKFNLNYPWRPKMGKMRERA